MVISITPMISMMVTMKMMMTGSPFAIYRVTIRMIGGIITRLVFTATTTAASMVSALEEACNRKRSQQDGRTIKLEP